jgi:hypothetical protein
MPRTTLGEAHALAPAKNDGIQQLAYDHSSVGMCISRCVRFAVVIWLFGLYLLLLLADRLRVGSFLVFIGQSAPRLSHFEHGGSCVRGKSSGSMFKYSWASRR